VFALGIFSLVLGYAMTYSGVSQFKYGDQGVGLFQALGIPSGLKFDLSKIDSTPGQFDTISPANPAPTNTGPPAQTNTPPPISGTVQV